MAKLTIATLCGPSYEKFLDDWKKKLPSWVEVIVWKDDSKGIFEAKSDIVHSCKTDYIWMIDVDDSVDLFLKENWFEGLVSNSPDRIILSDDGRMLWQYIFKTSFIKKCYNEVAKAKQSENIKVLDLVSCEDMVVTATNAWRECKKEIHLATKGVSHNVNDISKTNSTNYSIDKIKSLYRNFADLMKVSKHLDYDFMKWIVLNQCKKQYWEHYRNFIKEDRDECDIYINSVYKEIENE